MDSTCMRNQRLSHKLSVTMKFSPTFSAIRPRAGFTLVEMAVVLVIVGLMLGGMLIPITAQMDQRNYSETRQRMNDIREALIGYGLAHGHLPCPQFRQQWR